MSLAARSTQPEVMDSDITDPAEYARCLRDLSRVNLVTFTYRPTLRWLRQQTRGMRAGDDFSLLDVACGHGDMLRRIARWSARRGLRARLEGIDLNPLSKPTAEAATPPDLGIRYRTGDVFAYIPEPKPDFIVSSQFTHHLDDAQLVAFLRWMEAQAARGWFIGDLHRHWLAYYGFGVLATLMGWHRVVRGDGRISIARSFRAPEWRRLLASAGVPADAVEIAWLMPFRLCVGRQCAPR